MAATANATIQLAVPDGLRGRVMSVYTTIFAGSTPIGGPVMGGIASLFGVAISLAVGGRALPRDRRRRARLDAPQRRTACRAGASSATRAARTAAVSATTGSAASAGGFTGPVRPR